jgi:hypothetical protein
MEMQARKQGLVWGGLLILFGVVALAETFVDLGAWAWVAVLVAGGMGVYAVYATDRTAKWLLIVSYVLLAVASLVALLTLNVLRDPFIPTFVLLAIALPFLVAFLQSERTKWGLLIPAYVLLAVGVMVPLIEIGVLYDVLVAAYLLLAIAIPFYVVYARDSKRWWALIPAGITTIVGLSFLLTEPSAQYIAPAVLIIAGVWVLVRFGTRKET